MNIASVVQYTGAAVIGCLHMGAGARTALVVKYSSHVKTTDSKEVHAGF